MKRVRNDAPGPKKKRRTNGVRMKDLLESEWNVNTMPKDEYLERIRTAVKTLRESELMNDEVMIRAYTASMQSIWNNRIISYKGPTVNHAIRVFNFGTSPPTHDSSELTNQIVECFEKYVIRRLNTMTRIDVSVGLMMRLLPDQGLDQEHRRDDYVNPHEGVGNVMYSGPDFNSKIYSMVMRSKQEAPELMRAGLLAKGNFIDVLMDRESSKERFVFFANFEIRTHDTILPVVGARLRSTVMPAEGLGDHIWDPTPNKHNTCMFDCIRHGLLVHQKPNVLTTAKMIDQYRDFVYKRTGRLIMRKQLFLGYRMCQEDEATLVRNIEMSCDMLEECFNVRINLYVYDEDSHKTGRAIPCYTVYISKKQYAGQPTLHLLMMAQKRTSYYHVVYITRPTGGIQGYRCSTCNTTFSTRFNHYRHILRGHRKLAAGKTKKRFQYGSFHRPLTIWDKLRMCCVDVPDKPLQPSHNVIFKLIVNTGLSAEGEERLGEPLYLRAMTNMRDEEDFIGKGPDMIQDFLAWLDRIQSRSAEAWFIKIDHYLKQIPDCRQQIATELKKHGSVLPVLSYDPIQMTSLIRHLVTKTNIRASYHKGRYQSIEIGDKLLFLCLLGYTGMRRADVCEMMGIPKHEMIFPYRALEEGNMDHVIDTQSKSRALFVHRGRSIPWEKQTDIDKWTTMYRGRVLKDVLDIQIKREFTCLSVYIDEIAKTLRSWVPDVDLFRGNTTAPSLARMIGYKLSGANNLYIPGPKEGERINKLFRENMAGGPNVAYVSKVSDEQIMTYDANSLYPTCMMEDLPAGRGMFEFTATDMKRHGSSKTSIREHAWINRVRKEHDLVCPQHVYADDDEEALPIWLFPPTIDHLGQIADVLCGCA